MVLQDYTIDRKNQTKNYYICNLNIWVDLIEIVFYIINVKYFRMIIEYILYQKNKQFQIRAIRTINSHWINIQPINDYKKTVNNK